MDDEFYMNLVQYLTSKSYPPSLAEAVKQKIRRNSTTLSLKNGLLYKKEGEIDTLVIKRHQVPKILKSVMMTLDDTRGFMEPIASSSKDTIGLTCSERSMTM